MDLLVHLEIKALLDFQDHLEAMESLESEVNKVYMEKKETKAPEGLGDHPAQVVFKEFLVLLETRETLVTLV